VRTLAPDDGRESIVGAIGGDGGNGTGGDGDDPAQPPSPQPPPPHPPPPPKRSLEEQMATFEHDLERFVCSAKPAMELLEGELKKMTADCAEVAVRFASAGDEEEEEEENNGGKGGGNEAGSVVVESSEGATTETNGASSASDGAESGAPPPPANEPQAAELAAAPSWEQAEAVEQAAAEETAARNAQGVFAGLVSFSELLTFARRHWEADHGRGLGEIYADGGADLDSDDVRSFPSFLPEQLK
jgi:hypothetical protein